MTEYPLPPIQDNRSDCLPYTLRPGYMGAQGGMSLRDWFAGQALVAVVCMNPRDQSPFEKEEVSGFYKRRAIWAYAMADAMLAERTS